MNDAHNGNGNGNDKSSTGHMGKKDSFTNNESHGSAINMKKIDSKPKVNIQI